MVVVAAADLSRAAPVAFSGWYAGRTMVELAIPAIAAGWAVWVIVSAKPRTATESAG